MLRVLTTNTFESPDSNHNIAIHQQIAEYADKKGICFQYAQLLQTSDSAQVAVMKDFDAVIVGTESFTPAMIKQLQPTLKVIVRFGVGYDSVAIDAATQYHVAVFNTPGSNSQSVAEHAISLMLALLKKSVVNHNNLTHSCWTELVGEELAHKTVGLIGFGKTARCLVPILKAFSCHILAYSKHGIPKEYHETVEEISLPDLTKRSDIISIHIPFSSFVNKLINNEFIDNMKNSSYLINVARGKIIDEDHLIEALDSKKIAGVGLDVFSDEPLSKNSPLLNHKNVILSPHVAGNTFEAIVSTYKMAIDSIQTAFTEGVKKLPNLLNPNVNLEI